MAKELFDISLEEISAVDSPANPHAKVLLMKRKGGDPKTKSDRDTIEPDERLSLLKRLAAFLGKSSDDLAQLETDDMADEAIQKKLDELTKKVGDFEADRARLTKRGDIAVSIAKAAKPEDFTSIEAEIEKIKADDKDGHAQLADLAKARKSEIEGATARQAEQDFRKRLPAPIAKAFDDMTADDRAKFMKSYGTGEKPDDPVAKALATVTAANEMLMKRLEGLEGDTELAKTKEEIKDLDGFVKIEDFAKHLIALRKANREAADAMLESQRALAKQAREGGLFRVIGKDGGDDNADAEAKIDKAAAKLREADPKLTKEQAVSKAIEQDPSLYSDYLAAHPSAKAQGD